MNIAMLAAVLALAACDRADQSVAHATVAPAVQVAAADDADTSLPTIVERRHFDIYTTYRVLFDGSSDVFRGTSGSMGEGEMDAVDGAAGSIAACSMHSVLLGD